MTPAYPSAGWVQDPDLGLVRYQLTEVSDDPDTQVAQTIDLMRGYALADSTSSLIRRESAACAQGDPIDDVWAYLSKKDGSRGMAFVSDETTGRPWGDIGPWRPLVEALIRPCDQAVSRQAKGDCDDFSMYGAAHLLARGVPCSFVTVAADSTQPSVYSHVYLAAYPRSGKYAGSRVPMDLSHGWYAGWETPNKFGKRREWLVDGSTCGAGSLVLLGVGAWALYHLCRGGLN